MCKDKYTDTQKRKIKLGICINSFCSKKSKNGYQCHSCFKRKAQEADPLKYVYNVWKNNCKRRKKVNTVTLEEFKIFVGDTDYMRKRGKTAKRLQIDRIEDCNDNCPKEWCQAHGYHPHNIRAITTRENVIKENMRRSKNFSEVPF